MTTLVAFRTPQGFWIGSDRRVTQGGWGFNSHKKWVVTERWSAGCTGLGLTLAIMQQLEDLLASKDVPYVSRPLQIADALRDAFQQRKIEPDSAGEYDAGVLLTNGADLWIIDAHLVPHLFEDEPWVTIGAGGRYADGVLWALAPGGKGRIRGDRCPLVLDTYSAEALVSLAIAGANALDPANNSGEPFVHFHPRQTHGDD